MNLLGRIQELKRLVLQLLEEREDLQLQVRRQQLENEELMKLVKEQNTQLQHFQNQEKIAKIVEGAVGQEEEKRELKKQINQYIRMIDDCIAHLNQ